MDILATNETFSAPMESTYALLGLSPADVTTLEQYLQARTALPQQVKQHVADVREDSMLSWWCMLYTCNAWGTLLSLCGMAAM